MTTNPTRHELYEGKTGTSDKLEHPTDDLSDEKVRDLIRLAYDLIYGGSEEDPDNPEGALVLVYDRDMEWDFDLQMALAEQFSDIGVGPQSGHEDDEWDVLKAPRWLT